MGQRTIYLNDDLDQRIEGAVEGTDLSASQFIRQAIRRELDHQMSIEERIENLEERVGELEEADQGGYFSDLF